MAGFEGADWSLRTRDGMIKDTHQSPKLDQPAAYQIKVGGRLDESWSEWFNGMAIKFESGSDGASITTLTGPVLDQAALRGILCKIWDLNLVLISVTRISTRQIEMDSLDKEENQLGVFHSNYGGNPCESLAIDFKPEAPSQAETSPRIRPGTTFARMASNDERKLR
jgi:hypothetical protein